MQSRQRRDTAYGHQFTLVGVKQDASYFENKEPVLIYIGKKLKDSLRLEEIFTAEYLAGNPVRVSETIGLDYDAPDKSPAMTDEESEEIRARLRGLGYLG
jgi:hypothetical protein